MPDPTPGADTTRVQGFPPIADLRATRLVLGSMPGLASLRAGEYYAHPRNAFWPIIEALFDIACSLDYAQRCRRLGDAGIAVWDVLQACTRPGSLDADIDRGTLVANDFATFFAGHPRIRSIYFNGAAAEALFVRHVLPGLPAAVRDTPRVRLPSTSPANASYSFDRKLALWRAVAALR